ncbi:MAG TPA: FAD-binding oxidoreductase [Candidatus Binataceae bacterium]|nr:FAD-binding oxidoreductase [Candidatus Binataceae bacterium]
MVSSNADVIVIGAGVVGCSLAFHLTRRHRRVAVFDKGEICGGMSARSGALIRMHYTFAPEVELAWKSLDYFCDWRNLVGGECGFVKTGFALVVGSENADPIRHNVAMMKNLGVEVELCDAAQLREIDRSVNVSDIALAAFEPQSGYADPVATTRSLAMAAERNGANFFINSPVARILVADGRAVGIKMPDGRTFHCGAIVIAAGPWTDNLLSPLGIRIGIKAERAQVAFFARTPGISHLAYIDCIAGSYFRPHGAGWTLAGLGEWRPESEPDPDNFRETNDPEFIDEVRGRLSHRLPAMKDAPCVRGHAGIYDVSPDARAILGKVPEMEGLFVAAGFSGTGFKTAPAVGAALAELILEGRSKIVDISAFGFERILEGRWIRTENEYVMGTGFGHSL